MRKKSVRSNYFVASGRIFRLIWPETFGRSWQHCVHVTGLLGMLTDLLSGGVERMSSVVSDATLQETTDYIFGIRFPTNHCCGSEIFF
jgi:hypothetical protein